MAHPFGPLPTYKQFKSILTSEFKVTVTTMTMVSNLGDKCKLDVFALPRPNKKPLQVPVFIPKDDSIIQIGMMRHVCRRLDISEFKLMDLAYELVKKESATAEPPPAE